MSKINRDGWVVELDGPPQYEYGQKVRSKCVVRNDGTFPGKEIGEVLAKKGEEATSSPSARSCSSSISTVSSSWEADIAWA